MSPTDAELTFADHAGRFYARRYGFPPMVGRLIGYLAVCEPPDQTINELADALLASRSAIAGAVKTVETMGVVSRARAAGERMDRVRIDLTSSQAMGMDISEYEEVRDLAREGLEVLRGEGGIKALSGPEKAVVRSNALRALGAERYPQIRFATESIEQVHDGYRLAGMLHIHGMTRRRMIDVNTQDVGHSWRVSAQARVRQTDFGVKPYSLLMGAVKVADEVTVSFTADRVKAG